MMKTTNKTTVSTPIFLAAIILCLSLATSAAQADNLNPAVAFRLLSGVTNGTEPFLCNAGIRHTRNPNQFCHFLGSEAVVTGTQLVRGMPLSSAFCEENNLSCECTSPEGNSNGDFLKFTTQHTSTPQFRFGTPDYSDISTIVPLSSGAALDYQSYAQRNEPVNSLTFFFGSELQGTEYFVDVCYPPLGFVPSNHPECTAWGLPGTHCSRVQNLIPVLSTHVSGSYLQQTQLKFRAEKVGNDTCSFTNFPIGGGSNPLSNWVSLVPGGYPQGFGWQQSNEAACVIRYHFWESKIAERNSIMQPSRFEIAAKIPDKPPTPTPTPTPASASTVPVKK